MDYLLLTDFFAMSFLVLVLTMVRRRYRNHSMRLWTTGLLLILLECAARILYGIHLPLIWHKTLHVIALNAYFLAGAFFLRSAAEDFRRMGYGGTYLAINTVPHVVLLTVYGFGVRNGLIYWVVALLGCALGFLSARLLHRNWRDFLSFGCIWIPILIAVSSGRLRFAIYFALFSLYMLVAIAFSVSLPKGSLGKVTVVTGFVLWSFCFLAHPWIAESHSEWYQLASQIWNMQKFLINIGLLVVLFEKQIESNEWLALHDQLTGLPNRRLFEDRLTGALARAERDRSSVVLFSLDLNGFKEVNDTFGHDAGDLLLKQVSTNLHAAIRKTDTLARLGGDEFGLLAPDVRSTEQQSNRKLPGPLKERAAVSPEERADFGEARLADSYPAEMVQIVEQAERISHVLKRAVAQPVVLQTSEGQRTVNVSVSVGLAVYPTDGVDYEVLARTADRRMYEDKRGGGQKVPSVDRYQSLLKPGLQASEWLPGDNPA